MSCAYGAAGKREQQAPAPTATARPRRTRLWRRRITHSLGEKYSTSEYTRAHVRAHLGCASDGSRRPGELHEAAQSRQCAALLLLSVTTVVAAQAAPHAATARDGAAFRGRPDVAAADAEPLDPRLGGRRGGRFARSRVRRQSHRQLQRAHGERVGHEPADGRVLHAGAERARVRCGGRRSSAIGAARARATTGRRRTPASRSTAHGNVWIGGSGRRGHAHPRSSRTTENSSPSSARPERRWPRVAGGGRGAGHGVRRRVAGPRGGGGSRRAGAARRAAGDAGTCRRTAAAWTRSAGRPASRSTTKANEAFVADGYRNHRVAVIDMTTGAVKRYWGAYGNKPDDAAAGRTTRARRHRKQFGNPVMCAKLAKDGLVYVCDTRERPHSGVQEGRLVREGESRSRRDARHRLGVGHRVLARSAAEVPLRRRRHEHEGAHSRPAVARGAHVLRRRRPSARAVLRRAQRRHRLQGQHLHGRNLRGQTRAEVQLQGRRPDRAAQSRCRVADDARTKP